MAEPTMPPTSMYQDLIRKSDMATTAAVRAGSSLPASENCWAKVGTTKTRSPVTTPMATTTTTAGYISADLTCDLILAAFSI